MEKAVFDVHQKTGLTLTELWDSLTAEEHGEEFPSRLSGNESD